MKEESNKYKEKYRQLKRKLSDMEKENTAYKNRISELENIVENFGLKINQLEKSVEEKMLENEMQKVHVSRTGENLHCCNSSLLLKQLDFTHEYGNCFEKLRTFIILLIIFENLKSFFGHFSYDDEAEHYGGKKWTDINSFALMMKAYKYGFREFTLKVKFI